MLLDFGVVGNAVCFVLGVIWVRQILARWRTDLAELRSSADGSAKVVIVGLWIVTLVILWALIGFVLAWFRAFTPS